MTLILCTSPSAIFLMLFSYFAVYHLSSLIKCKVNESRNCFVACCIPQCLEHCLVHRRNSLNNYWISGYLAFTSSCFWDCDHMAKMLQSNWEMHGALSTVTCSKSIRSCHPVWNVWPNSRLLTLAWDKVLTVMKKFLPLFPEKPSEQKRYYCLGLWWLTRQQWDWFLGQTPNSDQSKQSKQMFSPSK